MEGWKSILKTLMCRKSVHHFHKQYPKQKAFLAQSYKENCIFIVAKRCKVIAKIKLPFSFITINLMF